MRFTPVTSANAPVLTIVKMADVPSRNPEYPNDAVYALLDPDAVILAQHLCSDPSYALWDLHDRRTELRAELEATHGQYWIRWQGSLHLYPRSPDSDEVGPRMVQPSGPDQP